MTETQTWAAGVSLAFFALVLVLAVAAILWPMRARAKSYEDFKNKRALKQEEIAEVLAAWQRLSNGLNITFYSGQTMPEQAMTDYLLKALPATMAGMDKAVIALVKE